MNGTNCSAQVVKLIDVMDQVQVNLAGACLTAPIDVKIMITFEESGLRLKGGDVAKLTTFDDFNSLLDRRVIALMMSRQKWKAQGFGTV